MTGSDRVDQAREHPADNGDLPDHPTLAAATVAYWLAGRDSKPDPSSSESRGARHVPPGRVTGGFKRVKLTESGVLRRPTPDRPLGDELLRRLSHTYRLTQLGTLAAGVAHDISNPVTYVYANLMVMQDCTETLSTAFSLLRQATRPATPERHAAIARELAEIDVEGCLEELSEMCHQNLSGMAQITELVSTLKGYARDQHEEVSVVLHDVVSSTLRLVEKTLDKRALVSVDLQPVPPFPGEATSLAQVIMNLLMNAAHAVDQTTGKDKRIKVSTQVSDQHVVLTVEDTGCGMTREVQERIFEPFYTTKKDGEGTGLGLALCRDIAHRHGGSLRCDSTPGEGSRFELSIPLEQPTDE